MVKAVQKRAQKMAFEPPSRIMKLAGTAVTAAGYLWLVRHTYRVLIGDGREKQSGHTV